MTFEPDTAHPSQPRPAELPLARPGTFGATARSVSALVLREMSTRYGRTPGGYAWALMEPLGMIIILGLAWSIVMRSPTLGTSFFLFKATGFLTLQFSVVLGNTVGRSLVFSKPLLFYPRVNWLDAIIARFALNGLVLAIVSVIILTGIMIYDDVRTWLNWGAILTATAMAMLLGLGLGCLNSFLFVRFPVWDQVWSILTRPLFLVSGVIILYEEMPQFAQEILWYNPILHLTGLMREGFYPVYRPDYISLVYVAFWIGVPLIVGLLLQRQYHRDILNR